jgi:hypothetical protein
MKICEKSNNTQQMKIKRGEQKKKKEDNGRARERWIIDQE